MSLLNLLLPDHAAVLTLAPMGVGKVEVWVREVGIRVKAKVGYKSCAACMRVCMYY